MGKCCIKKKKDQILLRCVNSFEANRIVEEIHEGVCGMHANGRRMAGQVMRAGYYWLTLKKDCIQYTLKCHKCQIYFDKIHVPPIELHVMTPPWPFSMWDMNVVITVSRSTWKTTKIKWSHHRSFLYGCDRSPETYVFKLGTKIPN